MLAHTFFGDTRFRIPATMRLLGKFVPPPVFVGPPPQGGYLQVIRITVIDHMMSTLTDLKKMVTLKIAVCGKL